MPVTVYVHEVGSRMETWAESIVGMGFGNLNWFRKLELYAPAVINASSKPTDFVPLDEDELIQEFVNPDWVEPNLS